MFFSEGHITLRVIDTPQGCFFIYETPLLDSYVDLEKQQQQTQTVEAATYGYTCLIFPIKCRGYAMFPEA